MKRFYLHTMGCQMNDHDSEVITGILLSLGYQSTEEVEEADLILYNTCCVRENPERKVYGHIGSYKALKEKNPPTDYRDLRLYAPAETGTAETVKGTAPFGSSVWHP